MSGELVDKFGEDTTLKCPYSYYADLRDQAPIFFSEALDANVVSRFADIEYILQNPAIFRSTPPLDQASAMVALSDRYYKLWDDAGLPRRVPVLAMSDGDLHRRYRELISGWFSPSAIKGMEQTIVEVVDHIIDGFIERGADGPGLVDLYRDFALLVPLHVFCDVMGVSRDNARIMKEAGEASTSLVTGALLDEDGRIAAHGRLIAFAKMIQDNIGRLREQPDDSLLSLLIHGETRDGDRLSEQEVISMAATLNTGGNETTTNGIGNTLYAAFSNPATLRDLSENREKIPKFLEEVMRADSPVASVMRWAQLDTEVAGHPIAKGSLMHLRLSSGNQDDRRYPNADQIDPARSGVRNHLAFGNGIHYCAGVHLSRAEIRIAMNRLFDRMEDIRLDTSAGPIEYAPIAQVRALSALPTLFRKRAA